MSKEKEIVGFTEWLSQTCRRQLIARVTLDFHGAETKLLFQNFYTAYLELYSGDARGQIYRAYFALSLSCPSTFAVDKQDISTIQARAEEWTEGRLENFLYKNQLVGVARAALFTTAVSNQNWILKEQLAIAQGYLGAMSMSANLPAGADFIGRLFSLRNELGTDFEKRIIGIRNHLLPLCAD